MLDSHGLVLFLLWLLAAVGVVMFVRWLNRFLERFDLERDTHLLVTIAFTGIVLFGVLNFLWDIGAARSEHQVAANNTRVIPDKDIRDVDAFIQANHSTLYDFRFRLQQRRKDLHDFFLNVRKLGKEAPHMRDFLQEIVDIRWDTQEDMFKTEKGVNLSLQEFWIYHSTGEKNYVANAFQDTADQLVNQIKRSLAFDAAQLRTEQQKIQVMLKDASKQLDNNGIPPDPNNRRNSLVFEPYLKPSISLLRNWLASHEQSGIVTRIDKLLENQQEIETRAEAIQVFLQNPASEELRKPMQGVIEEWKATSRYNQYALYQILYATELLYVLDNITDTSTGSGQEETRQQGKQLLEHLQHTAPIIADLAWKNRTEGVQRSYSPTPFFEGKKR